MAGVPDTRVSLILRLRNQGNAHAWYEFVSLYEPVIYRVARRQGLQHTDANETVQEVLFAVAKDVARFEPGDRGQFRTWLFRIVRNKLVDLLRRRVRHAAAGGGTSGQRFWREQADPNQSLSADIEFEYERELFLWAAAKIQQVVQSQTWLAFWKTSVEGLSHEQTAQELGMTVGAIYIAKCRILARFRVLIQTRQQDDGGQINTIQVRESEQS